MANAITKEEVQEKSTGRVRLIDIRSIEEFEKLHVPGAINIPSENLTKELEAFNPEDTMVCICNYGKERGRQAAEIISNAGFKNTFYLQGGTMGWFDLKNETEINTPGQSSC